MRITDHFGCTQLSTLDLVSLSQVKLHVVARSNRPLSLQLGIHFSYLKTARYAFSLLSLSCFNHVYSSVFCH